MPKSRGINTELEIHETSFGSAGELSHPRDYMPCHPGHRRNLQRLHQVHLSSISCPASTAVVSVARNDGNIYANELERSVVSESKPSRLCRPEPDGGRGQQQKLQEGQCTDRWLDQRLRQKTGSLDHRSSLGKFAWCFRDFNNTNLVLIISQLLGKFFCTKSRDS